MGKFAPVMGGELYAYAAEFDIARNGKPDPWGAFGTYHLLLAHDVAKKRDLYARVFRSLHDVKDAVIIMDNSVVELGKAELVPVLSDATHAVRATTAVIPDEMHDAAKTAEKMWNFFDTMGGIGPLWPGMMFVPQGKTFKEFVWCMEQTLIDRAIDERITWWGIPRLSVMHLGSRRELIEVAKMLAPHRRIHLLGFSDNVVDDLLCARHPHVAGIDSAVPVRVGQSNQPFTLTMDPGKRDSGYLDQRELTLRAAWNIIQARKWAAGNTPGLPTGGSYMGSGGGKATRLFDLLSGRYIEHTVRYPGADRV